MKMESFEVEAEQEGERLDKFLSIISICRINFVCEKYTQ